MTQQRARWVLAWLSLAWGPSVWAAGIKVHEAWIDPGPPETKAPAAYLDIENSSGSLRTITLRAAVAESVAIYRARYSADRATLERVPRLELPPHTRLRFQQEDMLAMLYGVKHALKQNEKVFLQLDADDGQHITVPAQVRAAVTAAAQP
jgi:copper(I)-binding protein